MLMIVTAVRPVVAIRHLYSGIVPSLGKVGRKVRKRRRHFGGDALSFLTERQL